MQKVPRTALLWQRWHFVMLFMLLLTPTLPHHLWNWVCYHAAPSFMLMSIKTYRLCCRGMFISFIPKNHGSIKSKWNAGKHCSIGHPLHRSYSHDIPINTQLMGKTFTVEEFAAANMVARIFPVEGFREQVGWLLWTLDHGKYSLYVVGARCCWRNSQILCRSTCCHQEAYTWTWSSIPLESKRARNDQVARTKHKSGFYWQCDAICA